MALLIACLLANSDIRVELLKSMRIDGRLQSTRCNSMGEKRTFFLSRSLEYRVYCR
jgi:hypothetical protein